MADPAFAVQNQGTGTILVSDPPAGVNLRRFPAPPFSGSLAGSTAVHNATLPAVGGGALIGAGHYFSRLNEASLPRCVAAPLQSIRAGLPRVIGGLAGAGLAAWNIAGAVELDRQAGDTSYSATRREATLTALSTGAAIAVGELGYLGAAAVLGAGGPVTAAALVGGAAFLGAGYAAYWVRERAGAWYDSVAG